MTMFEYVAGATPLDLDEAEGLKPQHITTQTQLNQWEQVNILEAEKWLSRQTHNHNKIINVDFARELHKRMFAKTWRWAGEFRQSNKNIGVDWLTIPVELKLLMDDAQYQIEQQVYPPIELATRFHHRLVSIHPFPNGNGRHARLMTDILLLSLNLPRFTWGQKSDLTQINTARKEYISALRAADKYDYQPLLEFVQK